MTTQAQEEILLARMKAKQKPETIQRFGQATSSDEQLRETMRRIHSRVATCDEPQSDLERALKSNAIREGMLAAGIPEKGRFWSARLSSYETPTTAHRYALEKCRDAVERFRDGDGLLLLGAPGGGKTHLLIAMIHAAVCNQMTAKFITAEGFFLALRSCMSGGRTEEQYIEDLARVDVLALDDIYCLAASKSTHEESYQYRMLWHLLDKRYFAGKATIASTNKELDEFRDMIDERTRRRLQATLVVVPKRPAERCLAGNDGKNAHPDSKATTCPHRQ